MKNKNKIPKLSPASLEIMKVVWEKSRVTVNEVFEAINAGRDKKLRRTTVQVQMSRLEDYGWLKHKNKGRTFIYSAVVEKHKTRKEILNDIINRVFGGSRAELVKCLLEDSNVTPEDIKELGSFLRNPRCSDNINPCKNRNLHEPESSNRPRLTVPW